RRWQQVRKTGSRSSRASRCSSSPSGSRRSRRGSACRARPRRGPGAADARVAAPGAAAAGGAGGDGAGEQAEESSTVDVVLAGAGEKKIQVIKVVRAATGLGVKEAKALVDEAPKPVKEGIDREEGEKLKQELEEAGGSVELK